jgi:hypothetical protein
MTTYLKDNPMKTAKSIRPKTFNITNRFGITTNDFFVLNPDDNVPQVYYNVGSRQKFFMSLYQFSELLDAQDIHITCENSILAENRR